MKLLMLLTAIIFQSYFGYSQIVTNGSPTSSSISMVSPVGSISGAQGTLFVIGIKVGDPTAVSNFLGASFHLTFTNDTYIEGVSTSAGTFVGSNPIVLSQNFDGRMEVGVTSTTGGKTGSGIIASCTLRVKQAISGTINIAFNLTNITGMDGNGASLTLVPVNNPLSVTIGETPQPILSVTPENSNVTSAAGSATFTIQNTGTGSMSWTASESVAWITSLSPSSGTLAAGQTAILTVNYQENTGSQRVGSINVTATGATGSPKTVTVTQETPPTHVNHAEIVSKYCLFQNYPNPFNPSTQIRYSIPTSSQVTLKVFDVLGNEVSRLVDEYQTAGSYEVTLNANNLYNGIYLYELITENYREIKKLVLIK